MNITTRSEARAAGAARYFTGAPCKAGHVAERNVKNKTCAVCGSEAARRKSLQTIIKDAARKQRWYLARQDEQRAKRRANYLANRDARRALAAAAASTPEAKARQAARRRRHYEANQARYRAQALARCEHVRRATPAWADLDAIAALYEEAGRVSQATGVEHHVDHVIPLRGRLVSGLHVLGNLQILSAAANLAKGNRSDRCGC